ncbi:ribokinase [Streptomyces radicis]|uniref:Ribokinase n=1 Tax=Streptomyces radicis TaxID=1750517 RepID=A0A3A9WD92_9ACTN|nr:ribokinase [Streptomyces radicis]RKN10955.1 ribokinase [Streptomyces radicis]RKN25218.1 ribokinase [Streptomyces radicis]
MLSSARNGQVLVIGSANEDHVLTVDALPVPGATVLAGSSTLTAGGKGANQAVAAARGGADTAFVAALGADDRGARLRAALEGAGVDTRLVGRRPGAPTGLAVVTVAASGENAIVVAAGANAELDADAVEAALADATPAHLVVVQCEIPVPAVCRALEVAGRRGAFAILNLAPFVALPERALRAVGLLVVNESEARAALGERPGAAGRAVDDLAPALAARFGCAVVVTLGARGARCRTREGRDVTVPAHPVPDAVDTTGAGDAFVGFLAAALARGADLADAARTASVAAALSVQRPGAQASFPALAEVDAVLATNPAPHR